MAIGVHIEDSGRRTEGRGTIRHRLTLQVAADAGVAGTLNGELRDLSRTGFLIETDMRLAEGETIAINLPHVGEATARVVWASKSHYGCRFAPPISKAALSAAMLRSTHQPDEISDLTSAQPVQSMGKRLKHLRMAKSINQVDFARAVGVSKPTVWKWETDATRPREAKLKRIAAVLDISIPELVFGSPPGHHTPPKEAAGDADRIMVLARALKQEISEATGSATENIKIILEI